MKYLFICSLISRWHTKDIIFGVALESFKEIINTPPMETKLEVTVANNIKTQGVCKIMISANNQRIWKIKNTAKRSSGGSVSKLPDQG